MKLHEDRPSFRQLLRELSSRTGCRADILEKDYYVCLLLEELSKMADEAHAYFKGGTALYKALRSIRRFSEDINLTVDVSDCPNPSQAKKRLEGAVLKFHGLGPCLEKDSRKGSVTCVYCYEPVTNLLPDALQRFGKVKVEGTSFTISKPHERLSIAPYLFEISSPSEKKALTEAYDVSPFELPTISLERIFLDKVFAAEFYFLRGDYFDVAKHVYDLSVLLNEKKIRDFLENRERLGEILAFEREESLSRKGGIARETMVSDFTVFKRLKSSAEFKKDFSQMQRTYVFKREDFLSLSDVFYALEQISSLFKGL